MGNRSYNMRIFLPVLCSISIFLISCYSFKGISIPDNVNTFKVDLFQSRAANAPATIGQTFSDALNDKITRESRLDYNSGDPDIVFSGIIKDYKVEPLAPTGDNTSALNRLKIWVEISYTNNKNEEDNWKKTFSQQRDFDSAINLFSVQDQYITEIFDLVVEEVFNKAFTNW